jgi:hypothetical protein
VSDGARRAQRLVLGSGAGSGVDEGAGVGVVFDRLGRKNSTITGTT